MDVFLQVYDDKIVARTSVVTEAHAADYVKVLKPGDRLGNYTYEQLREHGSGHLEVEMPAE